MFTHLVATALPSIPPVLLAEASKWKTSAAWGVVLLCIVLGVIVTVNPMKRDKEIKGRRE